MASLHKAKAVCVEAMILPILRPGFKIVFTVALSSFLVTLLSFQLDLV
jgi:hypothetical protein